MAHSKQVHSSSTQSLPSSQQPGVNEGAVNGCVVHRSNTVHRNNTTSRLPISSANTRQPQAEPTSSSSKSRYRSQDPPSSGGRRPIGDDPSSAATSHLTSTTSSNRFNEWSQSSEDSSGHALYGDDPPPSFHDALLAPVVGSRSEISLSSTVGQFSVRPATGKGLFHSVITIIRSYADPMLFYLGPRNNTPWNRKKKKETWTENSNNQSHKAG